jgi:BirA family biotin operon repressor/biotin-[acetyl-CoA-carboxylase] ligase
VQIRWPNDLYVNDAKLGGILVETVQSGDQRAAIIGVGLNVNQDDATLGSLSQSLDRRVASMRQVRGRPAPRVGVLGDAIAALDDRLSADRTSGWVEAWRKRCPLLHQTVKLQCDRERLEGEVLDLDPRHGLIVRHPTGGIMHLPATRTTVL